MPINRITLLDHRNYPYSPKFQEIAAFMGLPVEKDSRGSHWPHGDSAAKGVVRLMEWGEKKSKSESLTDTKIEIRKLQKRLGINVVGEELVNKLHQWVQLSSEDGDTPEDRKRIKGEMSLLGDTQANETIVRQVPKKTEVNPKVKEPKIETKAKPVKKVIEEPTPQVFTRKLTETERPARIYGNPFEGLETVKSKEPVVPTFGGQLSV